jgi:hypothetical protein
MPELKSVGEVRHTLSRAEITFGAEQIGVQMGLTAGTKRITPDLAQAIRICR